MLKYLRFSHFGNLTQIALHIYFINILPNKIHKGCIPSITLQSNGANNGILGKQIFSRIENDFATSSQSASPKKVILFTFVNQAKIL